MNKILIFSAPSGAGKTTIVKQLLKANFNLEFSISACTRAMRSNEQNGVDYYFLTANDFRKRIENEEFLEWEEVYTDNYYGTLKSEVDRIFANGNHVIFDVDVVGGVNIKKHFGDKALAFFVMPPSIDELKNRLIHRSTDSIENIEKRVKKATIEMEYSIHFDKIILNDILENAVNETIAEVQSFLQTNVAYKRKN